MKRILGISLIILLSCSHIGEASFAARRRLVGRVHSCTNDDGRRLVRRTVKLPEFADNDNSCSHPIRKEQSTAAAVTALSRRLALYRLLFATMSGTTLVSGTMTMTAITSIPQPAFAAKQMIKPDAAFIGILKAREELITAAKTYLPRRDFEGLRMYLADNASNMKNFQTNSQVLLESKMLDAESKRAIGTIRTYGVGADVMIMYGALQAELGNDLGDEEDDSATPPDSTQVSKYLMRTLDSLSEVISICRSNGFGAGIADS